MDRVSIKEVTDKSEPTKENPSIPNLVNESRGLSEIQDLNDLSIMFGFDSPGFDGLGREMESIYSWARNNNPQDPLGMVRSAIDISGINSKGRELIIKLHRWIALDTRMAELQQRKALIK